jgi:hypothetical protein
VRRVVIVSVLASVGATVLFAGTAQAHRAQCTETTNPHGKNTPPAGSTTQPGSKGGQNEDGFYLLTTDTGQDSVFIEDSGSGAIFGPFEPGTKIKYTQAPGATPKQRKRKSRGQARAVKYHITGTGDAFAFSGDGVRVACLVPPPPK